MLWARRHKRTGAVNFPGFTFRGLLFRFSTVRFDTSRKAYKIEK
jgi:hypothetical protein